jgi:hypothetical protein
MGKTFKKISINQVKLEKPGDALEGYLRAVTDVQMKNGMATEAMFQDENGGFSSVILGVSAAKLIKTRNLGEYLKITLKGTEKTLNGFNVNTYDIEVGDE